MPDYIKIDEAAVRKMMADLGAEANHDAINAALVAAAKVLRAETKATLVDKVPGAAGEHIRMRSGKMQSYGRPVDGVKANFKRAAEKVDIMGDFRLIWFETGTAPRTTSKGYYRGAITPTNFFAEAYDKAKPAMDEAARNALNDHFKKL